MERELEVYESSDYAGMKLNGFDFYYGYEYGKDLIGEEVWGLYMENSKRERIFQLTQAEMKKLPNCPDQFDCSKMLLFGIGIYLNQLIKKRG